MEWLLMQWTKKRTCKEDTSCQDNGPKPLARAYSHEASGQAAALFNALDNGFGSFEADVWLVDGKLLVGHDWQDLGPDRSLEELYLKPLLARVRENNGLVYPSWTHSVQMLLDIKTAAEP